MKIDKRELLKLVRLYRRQHDLICSIESNGKTPECPCKICEEARQKGASDE